MDVYGGVSTQEIENLIKELEDRKKISLDDSFNLGIDFTIKKLAKMIYEEEYVIRIYGK